MQQPSRTKAYDQLQSLLADRILILDGAMGTMIQALKLSETDIRGDRFVTHHKDLGRFSDILCLTRPADITEIHRKYLAAGADIIETNTFGASFVGMEEFQLPRPLVREINLAAVACARRAAAGRAVGRCWSRRSQGQGGDAERRRSLKRHHRETDDVGLE